MNCNPLSDLGLQVERIRADIRDFRQSSGVDKIIVLWTANTERFCDVVPGVNDTAKNLLAAIKVRGLFHIHKIRTDGRSFTNVWKKIFQPALKLT